MTLKSDYCLYFRSKCRYLGDCPDFWSFENGRYELYLLQVTHGSCIKDNTDVSHMYFFLKLFDIDFKMTLTFSFQYTVFERYRKQQRPETKAVWGNTG